MWRVGFLMLVVLLGCGGPRAPGAYHDSPDECPLIASGPRQGTGLALSGGGYRATLFHAGALRRMNELGLLKRVDEVSSVSGGSIAAGQLAALVTSLGGKLDRDLSADEWNTGYADPIQRLTRTDIRSKPILEALLLPWNWFRDRFEVDRLAAELDDHFGRIRLHDLPEKPDFVLDATDLSFGANWEFRRWRTGSYKAGYVMPPPGHWTLGEAVAASAAFPPVFQPLPVDAPKSAFAQYGIEGGYDPAKPEWDQKRVKMPDACWKAGNWDYAMSGLRLSDGGVYDNLALEAIWKDRYVVLASNAGGPFSNKPDQGFFKRVIRIENIMDTQARDLRKRWLMATARQKVLDAQGKAKPLQIAVYWGIRASRRNYVGEDAPGYSAELAMDYISKIRTDLDVFSPAERAVLTNHGYLLADASISMVAANHGRAALGLPEGDWPALAPPHPDWLPSAKSDCEIKKALFENAVCRD